LIVIDVESLNWKQHGPTFHARAGEPMVQHQELGCRDIVQSGRDGIHHAPGAWPEDARDRGILGTE
jgi:hypothetical protein